MKDGDVYFWRWKNVEARGGHGAFGAYHCYSQKAIVRDGRLFDTYWGDNSKSLRLDEIEKTLQGNINEMTIIHDPRYFRREDVVDMRHANSSLAPIYLKPGATRNADVMRLEAQHQIDRAESEIRMARSRIEQLREQLARIDAGKLDEVYL